jgi:hypothetical protein
MRGEKRGRGDNESRGGEETVRVEGEREETEKKGRREGETE